MVLEGVFCGLPCTAGVPGACDQSSRTREQRGSPAFALDRLADYVGDVAQVARQLSAAPIVIGHSMGGLVVQKYLQMHGAPAGVLMASIPPTGVLRTALHLARL
ncbi:MAG: alpha/beta hydrolase [Rhodoferax sp.]|nr:alpha/beta fold hydrolase [Rhodoferax sp.]NDP38037.1 alpha/beta hydrolase [Rhodoferax sp.]